VCGDGVINTGETCDDGNTNGGDGCSAACQTESSAPHVTVSVDKSTITTDLNVESTVTVTATSQNGFSGNVTLTVAADAAGVPITDWTTTLDNPTLALSPGASATATLKISAMGEAAMLTGSVKVTATGADVPVDATVATTFNPILDVTFADDGAGLCVYDTNHLLNNPFQIKVGRTIHVINGSATLPFTVHVDSGITGFPHESGTSPAGGMYTGTFVTADAPGQVSFYCHDNGVRPANTMIDMNKTAATRPQLKIIP